MRCTGDRANYARYLLEMATAVSEQRSRFICGGIAITPKPNVENRINALLDLTRPLSQRLNWTTTILLVAIVSLIALVAALRPSAEGGRQLSACEIRTAPSATDLEWED